MQMVEIHGAFGGFQEEQQLVEALNITHNFLRMID
jgi:hypothetical protein